MKRLIFFALALALLLTSCNVIDPAIFLDEPTAAPTLPNATRTTVTRTTAAVTVAPSSAAPTRVTATPNDGLKTIAFNQLPPEARTTITLIDKGGPFPYDRDGITFENREGLLPQKAKGYYHEYTVITPGSNDRGARRIIAGSNGELYYTDDHYDSFKRVVR